MRAPWLRSLALVAGCLAATSCGGDDQPLACKFTTPTECVQPAPRYADVEPIFQGSCIECHNGVKGEQWALTDYEHITDWWDLVEYDLSNCSMPPADAKVPLTRAEREKILMWLRCGFPQ